MKQTILTVLDIPGQEYAPFTAIQQGRGLWQVLDCNGHDYIGEYVSKREADRYLRIQADVNCYLVQTLAEVGQIIFADVVDSKLAIREVLDIGDDEVLNFKKDGVALYKDRYTNTTSIITTISRERATALRLANSLPATYPVNQ